MAFHYLYYQNNKDSAALPNAYRQIWVHCFFPQQFLLSIRIIGYCFLDPGKEIFYVLMIILNLLRGDTRDPALPGIKMFVIRVVLFSLVKMLVLQAKVVHQSRKWNNYKNYNYHF